MEITLKEPIETGENSAITKVKARAPRLIDAQRFLLALGSELVQALVDRKAQSPEVPAEAFDTDMIKRTIAALIKQERFDAFNEALGGYLRITPEQAGELALVDLVQVAKEASGFFTEMGEMMAQVLAADAPS